MNYIIGFDAGTTAFKAGLYDEEMQLIYEVSIEYQLIYTTDGYIEFGAENYLDMFCKLISELLNKSKIEPRLVRGISICSQGETLLCLDKDGKALNNAIIWTDSRAGEEAKLIGEKFSNETIFNITGQRELTASWPVCKILWLKNNQPEIFSKTAKFLLLEDYLIYKLTGKYATDKSLSSSTVMLDIYNGVWWKDMLDFIGIKIEQLPELYDSGCKIACISGIAAKQTGLTEVTHVISGALDQAAGMLGAGNIYTGIVTETTGTCLAVCANIGNTRIPYDKGLLPIHYGIMPNNYYTIYWSAAAGSIIKWIRDVFYQNVNSENIFKIMDAEAENIAPGSDGLILLPYLSGMNYPFSAENAKGVFAGITLAHTRGHFARAALEAVAFLLRQSIDEITRYGIDVSCIYSLGGGSSSAVWNQIKADVVAKNIITLETTEVTCKGAAMLAAVGTGMYGSFEEIVRKNCKIKKEISPMKALEYLAKYDEFFKWNTNYIQTIIAKDN